MEEVWKDIIHYEGMYQVSNLGRVRAVDRIVDSAPEVGSRIAYGHILSITMNERGYMKVTLYKHNKGKQEYIHRLVAMAFIPNPENLPQVNHKDENKSNNEVSNLEWCSCSYNNNYGSKRKRQGETYLNNGTNCYRVAKLDESGEVVETYRSMREAERKNNLTNGVLSSYFKRGFSECGGCSWKRT